MVSQAITSIHDLESKQRILKAAAKLFADKGFDGARVDEIAKLAQVNKALIYYYFKSKDELLEVLCKHTIEDVFNLMTVETVNRLDYSNPSDLKRVLGASLDALEEHEDVVRIMIMESLKRSSTENYVFSLIKDTLAKLFSRGEEVGFSIENQSKNEVMEFFTGIMPLLNYVVYHNMWMERFGLAEPVLRDMFLDSFIGTHVAFSAVVYDLPKVKLDTTEEK